MPKTLSTDAEERIISAVKRAVALVDDDHLTPDAAVEKVARAEKWGADMVRFAACAYNTGRQTAQRETAKTALDKFATFPLVNADAVIAKLYPSTVKSAAEEALATDVSAEYSRPPKFAAEQAQRVKMAAYKEEGRLEKLAADAVKPTAPAPTYTAALYAHQKLVRAADEARLQSSIAYSRLQAGLSKLAGYYQQSPFDRDAFQTGDAVAQLQYGAAGKQLMDWVYGNQHLKEARYDPKIKLASLLHVGAGEPCSLIQACVDLGRNVQAARTAEKAARDALDVQYQEQLSPFVSAPRTMNQVSTWSLLRGDVKQADEEGGGGGLGSLVIPSAVGVASRELMDKAMAGGKSKEDRINDAWEELEDPSHAAQLTQNRSQAMLHDLMQDPVISGYSPDTVLNKYNEISQMAPRASQQPIAMRTLLRRHLQGNIEPFEARELAGLEKDTLGTEKDTRGDTISPRLLLGNIPESIHR